MRALLCLILFAGLALPQNDIFVGTPQVRVVADGAKAERTDISKGADPCRIARKGRGYVWASRGNRALNKSEAGDWVYFVSPEGSGYVKVYTGAASVPYEYVEHVTDGYRTFTYWGKRIAYSR